MSDSRKPHSLRQAALPPLSVLKIYAAFLPTTLFPGQLVLKGCVRVCECVYSPSEARSLSQQGYLEIFCESSRKGPASPPGGVSIPLTSHTLSVLM